MSLTHTVIDPVAVCAMLKAKARLEREAEQRRVPIETLRLARGYEVTLLLKGGDIVTGVVRLVGYMRPTERIALGTRGESPTWVRVSDIADVEVPSQVLKLYQEQERERARLRAHNMWADELP